MIEAPHERRKCFGVLTLTWTGRLARGWFHRALACRVVTVRYCVSHCRRVLTTSQSHGSVGGLARTCSGQSAEAMFGMQNVVCLTMCILRILCIMQVVADGCCRILKRKTVESRGRILNSVLYICTWTKCYREKDIYNYIYM